jgi:sugar lactone lactonase YvrE
VYVADTANSRVRLISASTGKISTVAGTGTPGFSGDGSAASAQLNLPAGVTLDPAGNLYIADTGNNRVRKVNLSTGTISTVAGGTTAGNTGDFGLATAALLNAPAAVAIDQHGSVYIADTGNNRIREISAYGGTILPVAGSGTAGYSADGTAPLTASLRSPSGIYVDTANNVYFSDTGNNLVREITAAGALTTLAGASTTAGFTGDGGLASSASLSGPSGIAVDPAGSVYIADAGNNRVREINGASGVISTIAGNGGLSLPASGTLATLGGLNAPRAVALDKNGNVFIAASGDNQIANIATGSISIAFGTVARGSAAPTQTIALQNFGNASLTLSGLALSSQSSFSLLTGQTSDCSATTVLAAGSTCNLRIGFTPVAGGPTNATITVTDNSFATTASTQVLTLTGTGVVVPSVVTVTAGNNQTAHPLGQFSALTVKVTDSAGYAANGAQVSFSVPVQTGAAAGGTFVGGTTAGSTNTITVSTASDGTASATLLAGLNTGSLTVTATVPGVTTAAGFTETIAGNVAPVITLTVPAAALTYGQTATLNATLAPATVGANTTTGKVTFYDNGTAIAGANCTGAITNGTVAACSYVPLAGTHAITASYSGDSNFSSSSTSSGSNFVVNPLAITATTSNVSIVYGSSVPSISGTLTGVLAQDTASVTVSFAPVGATTIPDVAVYTLTPTLSGSAAANYAVTASGSPTLTVTQAKSTTALVVSPASGYLNYTTIGFSVTVAPATSGAPQPSGTVTVIATPVTGSAIVLGPYPVVNGIVTASVMTLPAGTYSTTAAYSGSTDYSSSTSSASQLTITGPTFSLTVDQPNLTLPQGTAAYVNVTIQPNQIFNSTVTLSCTNLPTNTVCSFFPPTLTNSSPSAGVNIATSGPQTSLLRSSPFDRHVVAYAAGLCFANLFILGLCPSRRRRFRSLLGLLLLSILTSAIGGCASGVSNPSTPTGSFKIMITGTATVGGTIITSSVPITLAVTTGSPLK